MTTPRIREILRQLRIVFGLTALALGFSLPGFSQEETPYIEFPPFENPEDATYSSLPPTPPPPGGTIVLTNPPSTSGFLGLTNTVSNNVANRVPPDTFGAVGTNHVVTMLNTEVRVHTRAGATISTVSLQDWWTNRAGITVFDPRIVYDRFADRWVATACGGGAATKDAHQMFAVSQTGDPSGAWYWHKFPVGQPVNSATNWFDYPSLGFNSKWLVVSVNVLKWVGVTNAGTTNIVGDNRFVNSRLFIFS